MLVQAQIDNNSGKADKRALTFEISLTLFIPICPRKTVVSLLLLL